MAEPTSMQHLFFSNGKINIFAWLLFIAMLATFIFTIYHCIVSIRKLLRDENRQLLKLAELELNLREIRGPQYQQTT